MPCRVLDRASEHSTARSNHGNLTNVAPPNRCQRRETNPVVQFTHRLEHRRCLQSACEPRGLDSARTARRKPAHVPLLSGASCQCSALMIRTTSARNNPIQKAAGVVNMPAAAKLCLTTR